MSSRVICRIPELGVGAKQSPIGWHLMSRISSRLLRPDCPTSSWAKHLRESSQSGSSLEGQMLGPYISSAIHSKQSWKDPEAVQ